MKRIIEHPILGEEEERKKESKNYCWRKKYKEINLVGNFGFSSKHFKTAYKMILNSPAIFERLITKKYRLKDVKEAFYEAYEKNR